MHISVVFFIMTKPFGSICLLAIFRELCIRYLAVVQKLKILSVCKSPFRHLVWDVYLFIPRAAALSPALTPGHHACCLVLWVACNATPPFSHLLILWKVALLFQKFWRNGVLVICCMQTSGTSSIFDKPPPMSLSVCTCALNMCPSTLHACLYTFVFVQQQRNVRQRGKGQR